MILSVSRRTDIPAFYSDWFFNRIKAGLVDVRNPIFKTALAVSAVHIEAVLCGIASFVRLLKIYPLFICFTYTENTITADFFNNSFGTFDMPAHSRL